MVLNSRASCGNAVCEYLVTNHSKASSFSEKEKVKKVQCLLFLVFVLKPLQSLNAAPWESQILNEMHFTCLFKPYLLNWFIHFFWLLYMTGYNLTLLRCICLSGQG